MSRRRREPSKPYLREVSLRKDKPYQADEYPFSIPAVKHLNTIEFAPDVTFLVGENGVGKSTLIEAIAVALRLNAEGGSRNFAFATRASHSDLWTHLKLVRSWSRPRDSYFLRAESFYNVASVIDDLGVSEFYGGRSFHRQSHGESFLTLMMERFRGSGLYILDEPEAALSPRSQLKMLGRMRQLVQQDSQFIIATHSPILLAYPNARILVLDGAGYTVTPYAATEHYMMFKSFLDNPEEGIRRAFEDIQENS